MHWSNLVTFIISVFGVLGTALFLGLILYSVGRETPVPARFRIGIVATVFLLFFQLYSLIVNGVYMLVSRAHSHPFEFTSWLYSLASLFQTIGMLLFFWGILAALERKSGGFRKFVFGGLAIGAMAAGLLLNIFASMSRNY